MYTNIYMIYDILFYLLFQLLFELQQFESLKAPIRSCSTELFEKSSHIAKKTPMTKSFFVFVITRKILATKIFSKTCNSSKKYYIKVFFFENLSYQKRFILNKDVLVTHLPIFACLLIYLLLNFNDQYLHIAISF